MDVNCCFVSKNIPKENLIVGTDVGMKNIGFQNHELAMKDNFYGHYNIF